jgi:hypothetical protein
MKLLLIAMIAMTAKLAVAAPLEYDDSKFGCIDRTKAEKYVNDYSIDVKSFGGMELCNSNVDTKKLFNDLQILEEGKFSGSGNNNLIRGIIDANNYYGWMKNQTRGIERGNDIPTATAYNSMGYFTMQDGWAASATLGRVGTVVHEARHTAGYRHYSCNQGPYEGLGLSGCDTSYAQQGSHAVEMEYYARVSTQGVNFHPVYKSMARLMAVARANFVFNQPVLQKREALLATTADKAMLFDKNAWIERELPAVGGTLKRASSGAVLFDHNKATSLEMYGTTGDRTAIRDDYSYFKLLNRKETLKDLEEFDIGVHRYVVGLTDDNKLKGFSFGDGGWDNAVSTNQNAERLVTTLENGETGLFLVTSGADIYPVDPSSVRLGSAKNFKWHQGLVSVAKVNGLLLALMGDGKIYELKNNQWNPWPQAANMQAKEMVAVPLYDAFEVSKGI